MYACTDGFVISNGPANSSITVQVPSDVTCTGQGSSCLIRLNNGGSLQPSSLANGAGPFGGCVAVSQVADATAADIGASTTDPSATNADPAVATSGRKHKNKHQTARALVESGFTKRFEDIVTRGLSSLVQARAALDAEILSKRQTLTAQLIDELATATGTAIDSESRSSSPCGFAMLMLPPSVPIDHLAGHDDAAPLGGNSTTDFDPSTAVLSTQQAIDLKKAVQLAIGQAMALIASKQVDAGATGQDSVSS